MQQGRAIRQKYRIVLTRDHVLGVAKQFKVNGRHSLKYGVALLLAP